MRTYGTLSYAKKHWVVDGEPHVMMRLRRMFTRLKTTSGAVTFPDTDETCKDLLWFMERYPLEMAEEHRLRMEGKSQEYDERNEYFARVLNSGTQRHFELAVPARDYQMVAADLALKMGGLLLADTMGTGKTVSAICMLTEPSTLPAVVVTLTHLPKQWEREINRFAPNLRVHVAKKGRPDFPSDKEIDVFVISYSKLTGWADTLKGNVNSIIFDEIQELRREESGKYKAACQIADTCAYRCGMSGTPIYNYGGEFYNVVNVVRPLALGERSEFLKEWCSGYFDPQKARITDPKAFGTWLRENGIMLRRTRSDIGRELPPMTRSEHFVDCDSKALEKVRNSVTELAKFILSKTGDRFDRMKASGDLDWRLRQATGIAKCLAPGTGVIMADGSTKAVEDIREGDLVMGVDSLPRKVLATTSGSAPMYRLSATGRSPAFEPFIVTGDHILALKRSGKPRYSDRNLFAPYDKGDHLEISVKDYISKSKYFKHLVKMYKSEGINFGEASLPIDPYFLGLWLGDGHSDTSAVTTMDQEIVDYLRSIAQQFGVDFRVKEIPNNKAKLLTALRDLGVLNNKHIPASYLTSHRRQRLALLAGLLDTDGSLHGSGCGFTIASKWRHLADQIAWLARSLGFASKVIPIIAKCQTGSFPAFRVHLYGKGIEEIPTKLPRKKASKRVQIKDPLRSGFIVESIGDGPFHGFTLEGDGLFLLHDFTVTHNCPYVAEFVKMLAETGEKIVVYAWHHAVFDVLMDRLKELNPVMYTGKESPTQKEKARLAFCEGDSQVMLISLRAGAGLDGLQFVSNTLVFAELDWSSGVHAQCEARLDRDGQKTPVVAYYLVSDEGSDPIISDVLGIKKNQLNGVIDPNAQLIEELSGAALDGVQRLAEEVLRQRGIDPETVKPKEEENA